SDMEFDQASSRPWETNYEAIQRKFKSSGYENFPKIMFWNLRDSRTTPVTANQNGVALLSGFSKNLLTLSLEGGGVINPEDVAKKSGLNRVEIMEAAISGEWRMSLSDAWVTGNVDRYVTAGPQSSCSLSLYVDYDPCGAAELRSSCSLRPYEGYTSRRAVDAWSLRIHSSVGLGPIAYCVAQACGPVDTIRHHVPPVALLDVAYSWPRDFRTDVTLCFYCAFLHIFTLTHPVLLPFVYFSSDRALLVTAELRPELPDRNAIIKDSPEGKIGMYTRFIEFSNYWILLSKFYSAYLSITGLIFLSCLLLARRSNEWLSFSKRGGFDDPCCYPKKFDSLKNWNNHFFWIDASVCLLSTSWFSGTSVVKDPLPVDETVDLPCVEFLNETVPLLGSTWRPSCVLWVLVVHLLRLTPAPLRCMIMIRVGV
ncbi:putative gypsy type transposase, partial [Tanacetum coccineum]